MSIKVVNGFIIGICDNCGFMCCIDKKYNDINELNKKHTYCIDCFIKLKKDNKYKENNLMECFRI